MKPLIRLSCLALASLAVATLSQLAAAGAGIVAKATRPTAVQRHGETVPVTDGFPLNTGDTVVTGTDGGAQLLLGDDSLFAVTQGSALRLDEFHLPRNGPGAAVFTLERGGFRTVTGRIGKSKDDTYEARVGQTTIHVQGSAYDALICHGDCGRHKDGLYVKQEKGVITAANPAGKLVLRTKQVAYVASDTSAPVLVKSSPFDDPVISARFALDVRIDADVHPERIEQVPPASPS